MPTIQTNRTRESAILTRAIKPRRKTFSPQVAKALLQMKLDDQDCDRLHQLAQKNQAGHLSEDESQELQSYLNVGMLLDLLQAKARASIKKTSVSR